MKRGSRIYLYFLVLLASAYFGFALLLRLNEQFSLYKDQGLRITAHSLEYGLLIFLAFLFAGALLALIFSRAGKRSLKETLKNKSHFWMTLISSLLCAVLAYVGVGYLFDPAFLTDPAKALPAGKPQAALFSQKGRFVVDSGAEKSSQAWSIQETDLSAFVIKDGASLELSNASIDKSGEYSGSDIFGTNAAIVAGNQSTLLISHSNIVTNAVHSCALACYQAQANINQSTLSTTQDDSPVLSAIESSLNLTDSNLQSQGQNSPVIYMETGTMKLFSGNLSSQSQNSTSSLLAGQGTFSLQDFQASSQSSALAELAGSSQVEMQNGLLVFPAENYPYLMHLKDSNEPSHLSLNNLTIGPYDSAEAYIYTEIDPYYIALSFDQGLLVLENSSASIDLKESTLAFPAGILASLIKSSAVINLDNQQAAGLIHIDPDSSLELNVINGSSLTTADNAEEGQGNISLHLSADSQLSLMGDLHLASLEDEAADYSNIILNGYSLYVNGAPL